MSAPKHTAGHYSDCAVHNEPAYPNGPCDCGYLDRLLAGCIARLGEVRRELGADDPEIVALAALREIASRGPEKRPEIHHPMGGYMNEGNTDDVASDAAALEAWEAAEIARAAIVKITGESAS